MIWRCRDRVFDLDRRTLVMGVLNLTPDSFSDGGEFVERDRAIDRARRLVAEGADLVDLGAESTRPGAAPVPPAEQRRRLMPVLSELAALGLALSVDTASAEVAESALEGGALVVNDVSALADPRMAAVIAAAGAGCVLMHLRGTPATMQREAAYDDVTGDVREALAGRLDVARSAGIASEAIVLDPGIGFAKTAEHNLELLGRLDRVATLGRPLMIGVSRKSFLGKVLDLPVGERLEGGLAATAIAVLLGARAVRTHDVAATRRAVRVAEALRDARSTAGRAGSASGPAS